MNDPEQLPLRDIHLPDPVSWWPPGWGWWVTCVLVVAVACCVRWWWVKTAHRRRRRSVLRAARAELDRLGAVYDHEKDAGAVLRELSVLLRRIGMSLYQREQIAGLCAGEWRDWLDRVDTGKNLSDESLELLTQGPYRRIASADLSQLIAGCRRWLKALPVSEVADDPL